ncbi:ABC transporter ATP-binding protein [Nakamurella endophytica]|uniref:Dipeptide/oligopeptide/nickel ABC transporter ATP-binding protein n=1 Tax=Nakamurella endophytica TaxID=1748367 RepID=A0A917SMP7_9ACTN|nr:ABC transporter ATP-binding protein [Nakamurella endophytica]GGL90179.1 dipeptide/oligopeptide/nickel ABC transporter ATP-binding protein [Nakamurella endophytica]
MPDDLLLDAQGVSVGYTPERGDRILAVREVDLRLHQGEFVGLVGESGCGKSTLGFAVTGMLLPPAQLVGGSIVFDGQDIASLSGEQLRQARQGGFALVLQSGMNTLNPVRTIANHFRDLLKAHGSDHSTARERGAELLRTVHLDSDVLDRYPHELSGGMRQRVSIALVLSLEPRLIVFDEPTTALDVVVQAAVMSTIKELQRTQQFTAVLISHDLGTVLEATDRVLIMYAGQIAEDQPAADVLTGPHHPYTEALLSCYADPRADVVHLGGIAGNPPDLSKQIDGCPYAPRCPLVQDICRRIDPPLAPLGRGVAACHVRAPASKELAATAHEVADREH